MIEAGELPKEGWKLAGASRVEEGTSRRCGTCGSEIHRYEIQLLHEDVPNILVADRACAERLTGDVFAVANCEREAQVVWRIVNFWTQRQWKTSPNGHLFVNAAGFNVTIFSKGWGFGIVVANIRSKRKRVGRSFHPTIESAKRGALDAVLWARKRL